MFNCVKLINKVGVDLDLFSKVLGASISASHFWHSLEIAFHFLSRGYDACGPHRVRTYIGSRNVKAEMEAPNTLEQEC